MTQTEGIAAARVIDLHAHVVLKETMGAAGRFGPVLTKADSGLPLFRVGDYELLGVKYEGSAFMDVDVRLAAMDQANIDFQVLSPNPLTYFHFIDSENAIEFCARHNDVLAALVQAHPNRLGGLAALPMQSPEAACEELERSVNTLGLLGAHIGTEFGMPLDDPQLDIFYEQCVALNVPLFFHPAPAGIDGPPGDDRLGRFDLALLTGFAAQETLTVATLIYGGVIHRHPELDICVSHGGGAAPFLFGRLREAAHKRPWSPEWLRQDGEFETQLASLWYDNHVHDPRALQLLIDTVGTQKLVFGTNFAGWDQPDAAHVAQLPAYLADNARRLLRAHV